MCDATQWSILITPTPTGYSLRETSGNEASDVVCSEVAQALTETLSAFLDSE